MDLPTPTPEHAEQSPAMAAPISGSSPIRWIQSRLAHLLGVTPAQRSKTVFAMMVRAPSDTASYWLQLCLSMCIATFGLVLNSSGVVIGAMLIAPLMGPIVELAMALTVGSPYLTLRSILRISLSIVVAVAGSAFINLLVPFHEVTVEIAARTTPTALDLFVAIFCALAAAFSVVRASSETVTTAAGTAISIALVPPLCVVGFGIGNLQWSVALGAVLLFTANLSAILMFAALFFLGLGFDTVNAESMEREGGAERSILGRLSVRAWSIFGHRYGRVLRLLVPLSLVGAVYIPLSHALATVAWDVRVRGQVQGILDQELPHERAVQSTVIVKQRQISLRLVLVAKPEAARLLEGRLRLRIAKAAGVEPAISVLAVPDEQAVRETALAMSSPRPAPPPRREPDFGALRERLSARLKDEWPAAAGELLSWRLGSFKERAVVEVSHLGPPLGAAAEELLARRLSEPLAIKASVKDDAIDPEEHTVPLDQAQETWPRLFAAFAAVREHPELSLCLWLPNATLPRHPVTADIRREDSLASIRAAVTQLGTGTILEGSAAIRLRVQQGPCVAAGGAAGGASEVDGSTPSR